MMTAQKLTIVLLNVLGLVGLVVVGGSFLDQLGCEGQLVNINLNPSPQQQIWGEQAVSQSFIAPHNDLNRVEILLLTYGRKNTHEVTWRLLEVPEGAESSLQGVELFSMTFDAATVRDQGWRTFNFPKIPDSAGKTYLIVLQSPTSEPGNAVTVGGIDKDIYAPGSAFFGPTPVSADITFRACFQMNTFEKLQILSTKMTQNRPFLWGSTTFYLLSMVIYLLVLIGFFWKLVKLGQQGL